MVQKRKPGGGRKPAGPLRGKNSNFSTRITDETRKMLEAEAAEFGQSISQVAERLIHLGLEVRREREASDPIRALCYLLEGLARQLKFIDEADKHCEWTNDAFTFDAFARATAMLFERLRPSGEIVPKEIFGGPGKTSSQEHAERVFATVWRAVQLSEPMSMSELDTAYLARGWRPLPKLAAAGAARGSYAIDDARRALGIKIKGNVK